MAKKRPGDEERIEAIKVALGGLSAGGDLGQLVFALRELHPRNNTFPGEVLLELAADAIEESGATRSDPIDWWNTDDLWEYALYAFVVYVRVAAERSGRSAAEVCARLAARHGVEAALPH